MVIFTIQFSRRVGTALVGVETGGFVLLDRARAARTMRHESTATPDASRALPIQNPYGSQIRGPEPVAASRDAASEGEPSRARRSCGSRAVRWRREPASDHRRRPDRRGQVPKGAGGCLGVIRIRAWKAAICPGELPNERRSRNTRATQGTETSQYLEERKSTETP